MTAESLSLYTAEQLVLAGGSYQLSTAESLRTVTLTVKEIFKASLRQNMLKQPMMGVSNAWIVSDL